MNAATLAMFLWLQKHGARYKIDSAHCATGNTSKNWWVRSGILCSESFTGAWSEILHKHLLAISCHSSCLSSLLMAVESTTSVQQRMTSMWQAMRFRAQEGHL